MTDIQWLVNCRAEADKIRKLIRSYHPVSVTGRFKQYLNDQLLPMPITAPNAEMASERVRRSVRENFEGDPVAQFDAALNAGDIGRLMLLMDQTWFGVPESTDCWKLEGFKQVVDLLDDPPDPPEESEDGDTTGTY